MNGNTHISWLWQLLPIWMALAGGLPPALIAAFKRRTMARWYLYGFACTLAVWPQLAVAGPLLAMPTVHALLVQRIGAPRKFPRRQRRADALALLTESSVRSYPSWIADLRRRSAGVDRRRYAYQHVGSGDALELVREPYRSNHHAVAYRHRGVHLGYVPKRQRWIADAMDDGLSVAAIVAKVKVAGIFRRRAKFVGTRIVVLNGGR
jgi:hypothetical protein